MEIEPKHNCKEWALVCTYISVDVYCTCALVPFHSPLPTIPGPSHFKLLLSLWYGFQVPQRSFTTLLSPVLNWLKFERISSGYSERPLFCLGGFLPIICPQVSLVSGRQCRSLQPVEKPSVWVWEDRFQTRVILYQQNSLWSLLIRLWRFSWLTAIITLDIFRVFAFFFKQ